MNVQLLQELMEITEEEQNILQQKKEVVKDLYTTQTHFIIERDKFLSNEKKIVARKHTRFVDFPKHKHDYIEINYVLNGQLKQRVGDEEITLKQGELLFLNQHIEHEIDACAEEDIILNFIVHPDFLKFIFSFLSSENMVSDFLLNSLYNNTHNGEYLYFKVSEVTEIQDILEKMIVELFHHTLLSDSTVKLYMGLLIVQLIKHSEKLVQKKDIPFERNLVIQSLKYIDENYQHASLNELAKQWNQPLYAVSKSIKKATNQTFKELLQEKRLTKAKELLETTDLPIGEVVDHVGYDNISYFYRIFKEKFGQTPKQLRHANMK
ncbi:AraC-like DNA-binding protein/mannose-6-phosphate isomerase-like protein (cupin superfamily) [Evansella vedderi]|uniref:AraC-like DNA-binding protein/mannose-6-phosphate isomerase-like protein (Cupin superfamily) n=1 Tax=Evansella vedderi TaxID=38282 RepID=A0ABU0A1P3_9BACI|nr:AraC family transcriptional regulator [Evansella vedderi]MDQ0257034.1 AraC-like DNA-binding protein/mannose-6-phosphate isomerase-like protein (cupin superfamily) [Evansella vedderi]